MIIYHYYVKSLFDTIKGNLLVRAFLCNFEIPPQAMFTMTTILGKTYMCYLRISIFISSSEDNFLVRSEIEHCF